MQYAHKCYGRRINWGLVLLQLLGAYLPNPHIRISRFLKEILGRKVTSINQFYFQFHVTLFPKVLIINGTNTLCKVMIGRHLIE